jgi:hypothetical protein
MHCLAGYKISPKPCRVPGQPNVDGTCMFVWECIKSEGTHVGVCVDTFMFGSCCVHNATANSLGSNQASHPGRPATAMTTPRTGTSPAGSGPTSHVTALQVLSQGLSSPVRLAPADAPRPTRRKGLLKN